MVRTVLIVDDDGYARMAVETLLARDPRTRVFDSVSSPEVAAEVLLETDLLPDVILLDLQFKGDVDAGLRAIPRLRELSPHSAVLMMSVSTDPDTAREAILRGADGFVSKNESAEVIADAVSSVSEGRCVISESISREVLQGLDEVKRYIVECLPSDRHLLEIAGQTRRTVYLYCLCGLSAKEIADEMCVSVHTINTRIRDAYRVLGASGRTDAFKRLTHHLGRHDC